MAGECEFAAAGCQVSAGQYCGLGCRSAPSRLVQNGQPRPTETVALGLLPKIFGRRRERIQSEPALRQVHKAVRRVEAAALHVDANAGARDQVAVDPLARRVQAWVISAETVEKPEMDARLVADFDSDGETGGCCCDLPDDVVFRLPGCIGVIEIEHVVVLDAPLRRAIAEVVPDGLEEASGGEGAFP